MTSPSLFYREIPLTQGVSRITLEITDVRVQRLQDISEEDAAAEGCSPVTEPFEELWDSINGEGAWDKNPWAWAVSFRRVS